MMANSWKHTKRRFGPDHVFFEDGNLRCNMVIKHVPVEVHADLLTRFEEFPCNVSGCNQTFSSVYNYEAHYNTNHRHMCMECHRKFPSNHLLDIHILEWHDIMFQLMADKHKMYQCLVEECTETFSNVKERKDHLITIHKYPSSFRFHRNRTHKSNAKLEEPMDTGVPRKFSYKVPTTICFGQGATRGFHRPRGKKKRKDWHQVQQTRHTQMDIERVDMSVLASALD